MPIRITVPRLGWSMEEGTFSAWLKHDGDSVAAGDLLFVLENDKASQEVESLDSGLLHIPEDAPKPGDKVTVGQLLGYLLADGESIPVQSCRQPSHRHRLARPQLRRSLPRSALRALSPARTHPSSLHEPDA